MKLRALIATAALASIAVAGCGGNSAPAQSGPVDLRMTIWTANEAHLKMLNQIADAYRTAHPDVASIKFDSLPVESYTTTVTTQMAGGNPPDLAWIFENSAPDFVASKALAPIDKDPDWLPSTTKLWEADGTLFAYPFSTSPFGIFVNTALLAAAGQQKPSALVVAGKWDWKAAIAQAAAVKAKTGKAGLVVRDFDYKAWDNLATVWGGWDAQPWSADGKTCGFDQQPMVDAMTFLHTAIFTDGAMPTPGTSADFFAGEAGMTITQISRASLLTDQKFKWELVPLPSGPAGPYAVIGQGGIGVLQKGKHVQQASDFLKFLTAPENSLKLAQYFPPPRKTQLTAQTLATANPLLSEQQLEQVVISGIETGVVKPSHTGQEQLAGAVRAGLDPLWKPDADVSAVLGQVCSQIAPLLSK